MTKVVTHRMPGLAEASLRLVRTSEHYNWRKRQFHRARV